MKVRILRGFGHYEQGQVFDDWPDGMCEQLIGRGMIEQVKDAAVETAATEPEVERAAIDRPFKKKRA
jgi:hypothetical protein